MKCKLGSFWNNKNFTKKIDLWVWRLLGTVRGYNSLFFVWNLVWTSESLIIIQGYCLQVSFSVGHAFLPLGRNVWRCLCPDTNHQALRALHVWPPREWMIYNLSSSRAPPTFFESLNVEIALVWLLGFAADAPFAIWPELTGDSLLNSIPRSLDISLTPQEAGFRSLAVQLESAKALFYWEFCKI